MATTTPAKVGMTAEPAFPTTGRIVHFQSPSDTVTKPYAALVIDTYTADNATDEQKRSADLHVWGSSGEFTVALAPFSEEPKPGHWNWPPRD